MEALVILAAVIKGDWSTDDRQECKSWFRAAEEAINALYHISAQADEVMSNVIISMYNDIYAAATNASSIQLAKFLFVIGAASLRTLVFAEKLAADGACNT